MAFSVVDERLKTLVNRRKELSLIQTAKELFQIIQDQSNFQQFPLNNYLRHLTILFVKKLKDVTEKNEETDLALEIVEKIIEQLADNPNLRRPLLTADSLLPSLLETVTSDSTLFTIKYDILMWLNKIVSLHISRECREGVRQKYERLLSRMAMQIPTLGDYDAQLSAMEVMMRFNLNKDLNLAKKWLGDDYAAESFVKVEQTRFEAQIRPIINALNKKMDSAAATVFSLICKKMFVGKRQITKPKDGYEHLWIDFNLTSEVIRVYCSKHVSVDKFWDTMLLKVADILRYEVTESSQGDKVLVIHLAKPGYLLFDSTDVSQFPSSTINMTFGQGCGGDISQIMKRLCGDVVTRVPDSQSSMDDVFERSPLARRPTLKARLVLPSPDAYETYFSREPAEETIRQSKLSLKKQRQNNDQPPDSVLPDENGMVLRTPPCKTPENAAVIATKNTPEKAPLVANEKTPEKTPVVATKTTPEKRKSGQMASSERPDDVLSTPPTKRSRKSPVKETQKATGKRQKSEKKSNTAAAAQRKSTRKAPRKETNKAGAAKKPTKKPEELKKPITPYKPIVRTVKSVAQPAAAPGKSTQKAPAQKKARATKQPKPKKKAEEPKKPIPPYKPIKRTVQNNASGLFSSPLPAPNQSTNSTNISDPTSNRKPIGDITNTTNVGPLAHSTRNNESAFDHFLNPAQDLSSINPQKKFFKRDYSKVQGQPTTSRQNTKMYSIFDDLSSDSSSVSSFAAQRKKRRNSPIPKELKSKASPKRNESKKNKSITSSLSSTRSLLREESVSSQYENLPSPPKIHAGAGSEKSPKSAIPAQQEDEPLLSPAKTAPPKEKSPPPPPIEIEKESENQNRSSKENEDPDQQSETPLCRRHRSPLKPKRIRFDNDQGQSRPSSTFANVERLANNFRDEMENLIDMDTRRSRSKVNQLAEEMQSKVNQLAGEMQSKLRQIIEEIEEDNAQMKLEIKRTLANKVDDMLF